MTATPGITLAAARAGLDAIVALLSTGGVAGTIQIFSGSIPATADTADSGTKLSTLTFSTTAFPASVSDGTAGAKVTANAITSDTNATGSNSVTAGYYRAKDHSGNVVVQGTVGTSSADMIISSVSIAPGSVVACSSLIYRLPSQ